MRPSQMPTRQTMVEELKPKNIKSTTGYRLTATLHAEKQIRNKRFRFADVQRAFDNPEQINQVRKPDENGKRVHNGQFRICGNGLALIVEPDGNDKLKLVTVYRDKVITPPRIDQLATEEGRKYAQRYARGLGRG